MPAEFAARFAILISASKLLVARYSAFRLVNRCLDRPCHRLILPPLLCTAQRFTISSQHFAADEDRFRPPGRYAAYGYFRCITASHAEFIFLTHYADELTIIAITASRFTPRLIST